jgi:cyanophycinase
VTPRKRIVDMASKRRRGGRLLIIGGAERRDDGSEILGHFIDIAGGKSARVIVCAAATTEPDEVLAEYGSVFTALGAAEVWRVPFQDRQAGERQELLETVEQSTAVFFTGGDQFRLTAMVAGTKFGDRVKERLNDDGILIAGSSAGAAAMSSTMIVSGPGGGSVRKADVKLGVGLAYLRDTIVDTHFNQRGRVHRLLSVFAQNPQVLGLGIDEDTAIDILLGQPFKVLGSGAVTVFDGRVSYSNAAEAKDDQILALSGVHLHVLPRGYAFDTKEMNLILPGQV